MKQFLLVSIILFLSYSFALSQKGYQPVYIIKNSVDTVNGIGYMNFDQLHCMFKTDADAKAQKLFPNEIDAFRYVEGKYYVSREVENLEGKTKKYFLEYLVHGAVDLFVLQHNGRYFIQKEGAPLLELNYRAEDEINVEGKSYIKKDYSYIGYIKHYLSDAPEVAYEAEKMESLNNRNMVKLSVDYHNAVCNEYECVDYTKKIRKRTYRFELYTGMSYHNAYYSPNVGFLSHFPIFKSGHLYAIVGLRYADRPYIEKDFDGRWDYLNSTYIYTNLDEKQYKFEIPIGLEYVFGNKPFKPTLAWGFLLGIYPNPFVSLKPGFIYSFKNNMEFSLGFSVDGIFAIPRHEEAYNNNFGHSITVGLIYKIVKD